MDPTGNGACVFIVIFIRTNSNDICRGRIMCIILIHMQQVEPAFVHYMFSAYMYAETRRVPTQNLNYVHSWRILDRLQLSTSSEWIYLGFFKNEYSWYGLPNSIDMSQ